MSAVMCNKSTHFVKNGCYDYRTGSKDVHDMFIHFVVNLLFTINLMYGFTFALAITIIRVVTNVTVDTMVWALTVTTTVSDNTSTDIFYVTLVHITSSTLIGRPGTNSWKKDTQNVKVNL